MHRLRVRLACRNHFWLISGALCLDDYADTARGIRTKTNCEIDIAFCIYVVRRTVKSIAEKILNVRLLIFFAFVVVDLLLEFGKFSFKCIKRGFGRTKSKQVLTTRVGEF